MGLIVTTLIAGQPGVGKTSLFFDHEDPKTKSEKLGVPLSEIIFINLDKKGLPGLAQDQKFNQAFGDGALPLEGNNHPSKVSQYFVNAVGYEDEIDQIVAIVDKIIYETEKSIIVVDGMNALLGKEYKRLLTMSKSKGGEDTRKSFTDLAFAYVDMMDAHNGYYFTKRSDPLLMKGSKELPNLKRNIFIFHTVHSTVEEKTDENKQVYYTEFIENNTRLPGKLKLEGKYQSVLFAQYDIKADKYYILTGKREKPVLNLQARSNTGMFPTKEVSDEIILLLNSMGRYHISPKYDYIEEVYEKMKLRYKENPDKLTKWENDIYKKYRKIYPVVS